MDGDLVVACGFHVWFCGGLVEVGRCLIDLVGVGLWCLWFLLGRVRVVVDCFRDVGFAWVS